MCQMKGCTRPVVRIVDVGDGVACCPWHYRTNTFLKAVVHLVAYAVLVGGPAALVVWMVLQKWAPIVPTAI